MSRIRELKPRVEPPRDHAVLYLLPGDTWVHGPAAVFAETATGWCEPPSLMGGQSVVVHSLEPVELPPKRKRVLIRVQPNSRWFVGFRTVQDTWAVSHPGGGEYPVSGDAWRPLPDDEPGDATCPVGTIDAKEAADRRYVRDLERRCDELKEAAEKFLRVAEINGLSWPSIEGLRDAVTRRTKP